MQEQNEEFKAKLRQLKLQIRRIMNGTTAEIMKKMDGDAYAANYGASLSHVRDMAAMMRGSFTAEECDALWAMRWRETMLTAIMVLPAADATTERLTRWLADSPRPEMVDVMACDLTGHMADATEMVRTLWQTGTDTTRALALQTMARAMMNGNATTEAAPLATASLEGAPWGAQTANGLSLMCRQMMRRDLLPAETRDAILTEAERQATQASRKLAEDLRTEMEYM